MGIGQIKFTLLKSIGITLLINCIECTNALEENGWQLGPFEKLDAFNPILHARNETEFFCPVRNETVFWERKDVFNPTAIVKDGKVHLLYRAEDEVGSALGTSRIGLATSDDGIHFTRMEIPIFYPENDEHKLYEWDGGCEDPRIVQDESGTFYMTYTAYDGQLARLFVATSKDLLNWTKHGSVFKNFLNGQLINLWSKSGSIVCSKVGDKFIPKQINGKYTGCTSVKQMFSQQRLSTCSIGNRLVFLILRMSLGTD